MFFLIVFCFLVLNLSFGVRCDVEICVSSMSSGLPNTILLLMLIKFFPSVSFTICAYFNFFKGICFGFRGLPLFPVFENSLVYEYHV